MRSLADSLSRTLNLSKEIQYNGENRTFAAPMPTIYAAQRCAFEFSRSIVTIPMRTVLNHLSCRVVAAAVVGNHLWLKDTNQQYWRYIVTTDPVLEILKERTRDIDLRVYKASIACNLISDCRKRFEAITAANIAK